MNRSEKEYQELIKYLENKKWKHTVQDHELWDEDN